MTANTIENKAAFIAQYWGQKILNPYSLLTFKNTGNLKTIDHVQLSGVRGNDYLELTPLSDISDEDVIEVANICKNNSDPENSDYLFKQICNFFRTRSDGWEIFLDIYKIPIYKVLKTIDLLRSKSYALPWMDLTIEDLQNYGWMKLKNK